MIFEKAQHTIEYYYVNGKEQKAMVAPFSKVAALADPPAGHRHVMDWQHTASSQYFDNGDWPKNIQHARRMVENFKFPQEIRNEANLLSRDLVGALEVDGAPKTVRNQAYGRFDTRAMGRVIKDLHKGKFSRDYTKPYMMRERIAPKPPHVLIVSDGSNTSMWSDAAYIPRMATIMLGVTWACEAVNCQVTTAITRDMQPNGGYSNQDMDSYIHILNDDITKTALNELGVLFHRDLYRTACCGFLASHIDTMQLLNKGRKLTPQDFRCRGGGDGHAWAKSRDADIIITIGDMRVNYSSDPERQVFEKKNLIQIDARTDLKTAIKSIADRLIKIKYDKVA